MLILEFRRPRSRSSNACYLICPSNRDEYEISDAIASSRLAESPTLSGLRSGTSRQLLCDYDEAKQRLSETADADMVRWGAAETGDRSIHVVPNYT
jgi:hypothetical protein